MKRIFILITIAIFSLTACTGSFKLVKTVNKFHRSQSEKWVDEVIFLGCVILPVYGLATLGDAIILNSVEFWTGKNPMNASIENSKTIQDGQKTAVISYGKDPDTLNIVSSIAPDAPMTIQKTDNGVLLKDSDGKLLFTSTKDDNGGVSVYDNDMKLVKYFSPEEVSNKQLL